MQKVDNYFSGYLDALITKKTFSNRDFGEGISKFVQFMPEIVLDVPQVHQYLFKNVIDPLNRKGLLKLKFIKWTAEPKEKPAADDDDDIVFDASDS
jgi:long-subunit acyl-CoA synthetase (AMP-forming)